MRATSGLSLSSSAKGSKIGFADDDTVKHSAGEYVRGDVHTNTAENVFSVFKRGLGGGVYQHCKEKHLHRYLAEFDFRYNNRSALGVEDAERRDRILSQIEGKRLTLSKRSPSPRLRLRRSNSCAGAKRTRTLPSGR